MRWSDLGLVEYGEALRKQEDIRDHVIAGDEETLLICEHPAVLTVGRGIGSRKEILDPTLPIFEVSRGGRATLHLPGQIVVYPILDLRKRHRDLHRYLRLLEEAIIVTLADFRIEAGRIEEKTGVWTHIGSPKPRKIASLGVAVKKWVTYHGLALNVTCDLTLFKSLRPCGFDSEVMTSVDRELTDDYRRVWRLDSDNLFEVVKTRLVENLQTELEAL